MTPDTRHHLHKLVDELKNIVFGTAVDATISWMTGEDFDLIQSVLANSSYGDLVQVYAKLESGDYLGAIEHTIALGASVGVGKNVEKLNQLSEKVRKYKGSGKAGLGSNGYQPKPGIDIDFRGSGKTYKDALDEAFKRTGVPKEEFEVKKWAKDSNGKSFPVEWRAPNGAEVNIDLGHTQNGPEVPHIGYQTGGKRASGGAERGHIFVDDVPINR